MISRDVGRELVAKADHRGFDEVVGGDDGDAVSTAYQWAGCEGNSGGVHYAGRRAGVVDATSESLIYTTADNCLHISLYTEAKYFPRIRCLYSREREIRYTHHQIVYLTEMALMQHTSLPLQFVSYEEFRRKLPAMMNTNDALPWEGWIAESLQGDGAQVMPIDVGPDWRFGGQFYYVTDGNAAGSQ